MKHLRELIRMGIEHKGSAHINVLQSSCEMYIDERIKIISIPIFLDIQPAL